MIRSSIQLKDKVRNLSHGDGFRAQTLIRNYVMERFLERASLSPFRNSFILKGGMLVASVVGLDTRSTMDIDTTIRNVTLTKEDAKRIVEEVIAVPVDDGVVFSITKVADIMEGHKYPGVRITLAATLDRLRQAIKIDMSTGDVITPGAVMREYNLMFEDRTIPLWSYNIETLLAEKLETVMARGVANTRMRDFYDLHVLSMQETYDLTVLSEAFRATCRKRGTEDKIPELSRTALAVAGDAAMRRLWDNYAADNFYVGHLSWDEVMASVTRLTQEVRSRC